MATCSTLEAEESMEDAWEDQDQYAIYRLYHVMGLKDGLNAVGVTKNWSRKGLQRVLRQHIKLSEEEVTEHRPFYLQLKRDHILYMVEKVVSYPNLNDCVTHMAMMAAWEPFRPAFLVPDSQRKKITRLGASLVVKRP